MQAATLCIVLSFVAAPSRASEDEFAKLREILHGAEKQNPAPKHTPALKQELAKKLLASCERDQEACAARRKEAESLLTALVRDWPAFERKDESLFLLGTMPGRDAQGRVNDLWTLIKHYPKSPFVSEAWLLVGMWFEGRGQLPQASRAFHGGCRVGNTAACESAERLAKAGVSRRDQ